MKLRIILLALLAACLSSPNASTAAVCANCHVMHASQTVGAVHSTNAPLDYLLTSSCIACHTGTNGTDGSAPTVPFVNSNVLITDLTKALAGGDFYFANLGTTASNRKGHNPKELTNGIDEELASPPGWVAAGFAANGQVGTIANGVAATQLSCAGVYGCHGTHDATGVTGAHHSNSTGDLGTANTTGNSFRFLYGIKGYEAVDYEYSAATANGSHNVYWGEARSGNEATADAVSDTATMSYFCAECHGIFHSGSGSNDGIADAGDVFFTSPWIRHPVDVDMPTTGGTEYAAYAYVTDVPVATENALSAVGALDTSLAGNRVVMCLSCHRAHASPWDAALRWDPSLVSSGVAAAPDSLVGCFACHSFKDDGD